MSKPNNDVRTGKKSGIGTSAVRLVPTSVTERCNNGVQIKAHTDNTGIIYVGTTSEVTADSNDSTDGYPLAADESVLMPVIRPEDIYVISDTADQECFWIVA